MDEVVLLTLEGLQLHARRTTENPPRVAIYDVIALIKKCDQNYAGQIYLRLLDAGAVPKCVEIQQDLVHANCMDQISGHVGGNRKPVRVATASEMVRILLQGATCWQSRWGKLAARSKTFYLHKCVLLSMSSNVRLTLFAHHPYKYKVARFQCLLFRTLINALNE